MSDPIEITQEMSEQFDAAFPVRPDYECIFTYDDEGGVVILSKDYPSLYRPETDPIQAPQDSVLIQDPPRFFPAVASREFSLEYIQAHIIWRRYHNGQISEAAYQMFEAAKALASKNPEAQDLQDIYRTQLTQLSGELK